MSGKLKQIVAICSILSLPILLVHFAQADDLIDTLPMPPCAEGSDVPITTTTQNSMVQTLNSNFRYLFNSTDQPAWVTRTDFFYETQQKNTPVIGFETIQPLYECGRCHLFGQGRAGYTSGGTTFNVGLGHRYLTINKNLMLGINAFFDEVFRYPHKRVGLGGEVFTPYVTFRANYYNAYTGQRYTGDNTYERASSGFDASVETPVPYISWMRFTLKGYHWKGNRANNVNGGLINFRVYPARQLEVAVGYANDSYLNSQLFLNLNYYFGSPDFIQYSASTPHPCPLFAAQDLEKIHLEKVLRTNPIVVEKTHAGSPRGILVARTD